MIDWAWIPGAVAGTAGVAHSLWLRRRWDTQIASKAHELQRQIMDQYQHGLMLWPRPWHGNRPLNQAEKIVEANKTWLGEPLDPEEQHKQMLNDTQRLLGSYEPRKPHE
jgi:hypothetical protein